jgi:hypothetical protein
MLIPSLHKPLYITILSCFERYNIPIVDNQLDDFKEHVYYQYTQGGIEEEI